MGYFSYLAEQWFKKDESGNNLFFTYGPFSRPYIIPDTETKAHLLKKATWYNRIFLPFVLIVLLISSDYFTEYPVIIFPFLIIVILLQFCVFRLTFGSDLRDMKRLDRKISLKQFYKLTSKTHSKNSLFLGFLGSLLFVFAGIFILIKMPESKYIAWMGIIFFGFCAVAWGYSFAFKRKY